MSASVLPLGVVAGIVLATLVLRDMTPLRRLVGDLAAFVAVSGLLWWRGESPLFSPAAGALSLNDLAVRAAGVLWWFMAARLAVAALRFILRHDQRSRETRLVSDLAAASLYLAAGFAVLNSVLELPVAGLLATSGIIAVVIGLALQSTLADVFAGIAVGLEAPFRVGDRIRLDEQFEGLVIEANWRSIRLQTDDDDVAVIPNSRVAKSEIINRSSPSLRRVASVDIPCPAIARPEMVFELLSRATLLCPAILDRPAPVVSLRRLGVRTNLYRVTYTVAETGHLSATSSLLLRQVRREFQHAGLVNGPSGEPGVVADDAGRSLLAETPLFADLEADILDSLVDKLRTRTLEPGDILFEEGADDAALYLVASGVLSVERQPENGGLIGRLGVGDSIGEVSLLTGEPHSVSARAVTHARVYQLSGETLSPLLARRPDLAERFDRSCRKGLTILQRAVSASASPAVGGPGELLTRIRRFLHADGAAPPV